MAKSKEADEVLVAEFERTPFGPFSRELREMLHVFRNAPLPGKYCLVVAIPHSLYQLALLSGVPGQKPSIVEGVTFTTQHEAEIEIFKRRLRDLRLHEQNVRNQLEDAS